MTTTINKALTYDLWRLDRPGWIPETVGDDWDPNPYAYQSREELMPAGHLHGLYLHTLLAMLKPVLDRLGLRLFIDVFLFYRDWEGRKQRIAPDAVFAPAIEPTASESLHKYDLDYEPRPLCAVEIISPSSREDDLNSKREFYAGLGISEYLVLDVEDENEQPLPQIAINLWRLHEGRPLAVEPDSDGFLLIKCIGVRLRADGRKLIAFDTETQEQLLDTPELGQARQQAERQVRLAFQARYHTEQLMRHEQKARYHTEQLLRIETEARQQAEQQAQLETEARQQAEQQAQLETEARQQAEAEVAHLRAEVARLKRATSES